MVSSPGFGGRIERWRTGDAFGQFVRFAIAGSITTTLAPILFVTPLVTFLLNRLWVFG